jgi:NTP pyrophosphatase (non-canonical NTP hydrolase)
MFYMVHVGQTGAVFVKEREFFVSQGGDREPWGRSWREVEAESIEDARRKGCEMLPGAKPHLMAGEAVGGSGDFSIGGDLWPGLSKLAEECGEVLQVVGKLIGSRGREEHWDGTDLRLRLESELADLLAAIAFVVSNNELDHGAICRREIEKFLLFEKWHKGAL